MIGDLVAADYATPETALDVISTLAKIPKDRKT
jgi:hypothetical protein